MAIVQSGMVLHNIRIGSIRSSSEHRTTRIRSVYQLLCQHLDMGSRQKPLVSILHRVHKNYFLAFFFFFSGLGLSPRIQTVCTDGSSLSNCEDLPDETNTAEESLCMPNKVIGTSLFGLSHRIMFATEEPAHSSIGPRSQCSEGDEHDHRYHESFVNARLPYDRHRL